MRVNFIANRCRQSNRWGQRLPPDSDTYERRASTRCYSENAAPARDVQRSAEDTATRTDTPSVRARVVTSQKAGSIPSSCIACTRCGRAPISFGDGPDVGAIGAIQFVGTQQPPTLRRVAVVPLPVFSPQVAPGAAPVPGQKVRGCVPCYSSSPVLLGSPPRPPREGRWPSQSPILLNPLQTASIKWCSGWQCKHHIGWSLSRRFFRPTSALSPSEGLSAGSQHPAQRLRSRTPTRHRGALLALVPEALN
jgi:hypothetical protein